MAPLAQSDIVPELSLIHGGPLYNLRNKIGLVPQGGLGVARRTAALVAVVWLPVVIGAMFENQLLPGETPDPLLRHFVVHARLLIAIPLLVFAESAMDPIVPGVIRQFTLAGLVIGHTKDEFIRILRRTEALRDSVWGKLFVIVAILGTIISPSLVSSVSDELSWATSGEGSATRIGFAGWWLVYVGRPVFVGLLALWAWRLFVGWRLAQWTSSLELQLVPSHPDRAGGLGFLQQISIANAWLVLPISVVLAARWAHEILYHGAHVDSLKPLVAAYLAIVLLVFMGPMLLFSRNLYLFKQRAHLQYSALVGTQGRLVYRKWIHAEEVGDLPILDSPELGCVADVNTVFEAVHKMRIIPIGTTGLLPPLAAIAIPMLPVFAIEVPIKDLIMKIVGSIF